MHDNLNNQDSIKQGISQPKELYDVKVNLKVEEEAVIAFLLDIDLIKKQESASMLILDSLLNDFYKTYKDSSENFIKFILIGYCDRYVSAPENFKLSEMLQFKSKVKDLFKNEPKSDGLNCEISAINKLAMYFELNEYSQVQKVIFHLCKSESSSDNDKVELENLNIPDLKYEIIFFTTENIELTRKLEDRIEIQTTVVNLKK